MSGGPPGGKLETERLAAQRTAEYKPETARFVAQLTAAPQNKDLIFLARHQLQSGYVQTAVDAWEDFKQKLIWAGEDGAGFDTPDAVIAAAAEAGLLDRYYRVPSRFIDILLRRPQPTGYDAVAVRLDIEREITAAVAEELADDQTVIEHLQNKRLLTFEGSAWRLAMDTSKPGPWGLAPKRAFLRACDLRTPRK